jgi:hypothetical protein
MEKSLQRDANNKTGCKYSQYSQPESLIKLSKPIMAEREDLSSGKNIDKYTFRKL